MAKQYPPNDAVHFFMSELTSKLVAKSGNPSDRFHLGKIILHSLKDAPDFIAQIDGATGESETNQSILERSVQCATAFNNFGLKPGDVIVTMAPNHIDLAIPVYAALYTGISVAPIDRTLTINEIRHMFQIEKPKLIFCHNDKSSDVQCAVDGLNLKSDIVTFDKSDVFIKFTSFLDKYADDIKADKFRPTDFNPEDTIAFLIPTSGTTGLSKAASATHKNLTISGAYFLSRLTNFPTPFRMSLVGAPLQWVTALLNFYTSPIMRFTRLQSSKNLTQQHAYYLLNTYKPDFTLLSPTMMATLINPADRNQCDFSCLDLMFLGGSPVAGDLITEVKQITPKTEVFNIYGMTELTGLGLQVDNTPLTSCGKPVGNFLYRLVDVRTQEDILEPNKEGELWLKGPSIFKGYYNNATATEEAFAEGRWFKTGDMFYRDEGWNYYFVDRIKMLLKYKSYQISPVEIETVIRQHPNVLDVGVTGIPDPESGDLLVACVVRRGGYNVTAQQIKDLVKESLSDSKQLRGGVIFIDEIPIMASTKVHRKKLKEMAMHMKKE